MPPINAENIKKILVIQFKPYGDVLLSTVYLKALKDRFSKAEIHYLVSAPFDCILDKNPFIDKTIVLPRGKGTASLLDRLRLFRSIRKEKYDLIIDQQNANLSRQTLLFSKARHKLGWENGKAKSSYTLKAARGEQKYSGAAKFDMVKPLGIDPGPIKLFYHIKDESKKKISSWFSQNDLNPKETVMISPGSPVAKKKWNSDLYAETARLIIKHGRYQVLFLWGPKEEEDVDRIRSQIKEKTYKAPPTDFNEGAALLKKGLILLCNDGGLNHLSVATETPALCLFGATSWKSWSPAGYAPFHEHLYTGKNNVEQSNDFGLTPEKVFNRLIKMTESIKNKD